MKLLGHLAALLVAVPLGLAGLAKLIGDNAMVQNFTRWDYPGELMVMVGFLELIAAMLVLLPFSRLVGAGLALSVMIAAIGTHVLNGQLLEATPPMAIAGLALVAGLVGRRRDR